MYKFLQNSTSIVRLVDSAVIPADPANLDYAQFLKWQSEGNTPLPADTPPEPTRSQWEEAARIKAAKAIKPNFEAVGMMLAKRAYAGADVPVLTAFLAAIEPITSMDLAASVNEVSAYAIMLRAYNTARIKVPTELRNEFSLIVAQILKRAL